MSGQLTCAEEIVTTLHKLNLAIFVYGTMVEAGSPIFSLLPVDGASETAYTVSEGVFH